MAAGERVASAARYAVEALEQRVMLAVGAPTSLAATAVASGQADLVWTDSADNETGYKVERKLTAGGTFAVVATLAADATAWSDPALLAGTGYTWEVYAFNASEQSPRSNAAAATTAALPEPWAAANVGSTTGGNAGYAPAPADRFNVASAGGGIGGSADDFHFTYQQLTGDGQVLARVADVQYTNALAKAGVMFRTSLAANARNVLLAVTPGAGAQFQYRSADGGGTTPQGFSGWAADDWVKLVRAGSRLTGFASHDGSTWTQLAQVNLNLPPTDPVYVGLALSASGYGAVNASRFEGVSVNATPHPLPAGWTGQDLGSATIQGSSRFYDDAWTFEVESTGQNVGGTSDAFHYAHRTVTGDIELVAKVEGMGADPYPLAKAGLMFRAGMTAGAANVFIAITGANGAVFQYRSSPGGSTTETYSAGKAAPYWVKLVRSGDSFSGWVWAGSGDWVQVGSTVTVAMDDDAEAGLALSAAGYGSVNTTTFRHVTFAPTALTATVVNGGRIDLAWADSAFSEDGYELERAVDGGAMARVGFLSGHASGYVDSDVDPDHEYTYRLRALVAGTDPQQNTPWSNTATGSTVGVGDGLSATFFDGADFSGTTVTRVEPQVVLQFADGQAPSGIAANTFAAEYTGQVYAPETGTYTFDLYSDDGVLLWVGNDLVVNRFRVQTAEHTSGTIHLDAGSKYNVRLLYFQNYGSANLELKWGLPTNPTNLAAIPTDRLFSAPGTGPAAPPGAPVTPATFDGSAPLATNIASAPRVDLDWSASAGADLFVVYRSEDGGKNYTVADCLPASELGLTDDDEGRLLDLGKDYSYRLMPAGAGGRAAPADLYEEVTGLAATPGDVYVILGWTDAVAGEAGFEVRRRPAGGTDDDWVEVGRTAAGGTTFTDGSVSPATAYEYMVVPFGGMVTAPAGATVGTTTLSAPAGDVAATFFPTADLSGPSLTTAFADLSALNWGLGAPALGFPGDGFSAVFATRVTVPAGGTGDYAFRTVANGGVRVYVDTGGDRLFSAAERVIDAWADTPSMFAPDGVTPLPQMFDGDDGGVVGFGDLLMVAQNYDLGTHAGDPVPLRTQGDLDADGVVGFGDLLGVSQHYGQAEAPVTTTAANAVTLAAGQTYTVRVEYFDEKRLAELHVQWKGPNDADFVDLPTTPAGTLAVPVPPTAVTFDPQGTTGTEGGTTTVGLSGTPATPDGDPIVGWYLYSGAGAGQWVDSNPTSVDFAWTHSGTRWLRAWAIGGSGIRYPAVLAGSGGQTWQEFDVANVAPTVDAGADQSVDEGDLVSLHAAGSDAGADDVLYYHWDVTKDGSPFADGDGADFDFTPDDEGTYVATVTVTDEDGATATDAVAVTADNVIPTADAGEDFSVDEGDLVSLYGFGTDPGPLDTLTYHWTVVTDNGQSVGPFDGESSGFTARDDGTYTITLRVTDDDGEWDEDTVAVTAANVAPAATISAGYRVDPTLPLSPALGVTDPGEDDALTYQVDWGDNTPPWSSAGTDPLAHTYSGGGEHPQLVDRAITLTADDGDGGTSADTVHLAVDYVNGFGVSGGPGGWYGAVAIAPADDDQVPAARRFLGKQGGHGSDPAAALFGNGDSTALTLSALPAHDVLTVGFDLIRVGTWATQAFDPAKFKLKVGGQEVAPNPSTETATALGLGYEAGTSNSSTSNYADSAYHLSYTFVHGGSSAAIEASATGLTTSPAADAEFWALDNVRISADRVDLVIDDLPEEGRYGPDEGEGGYVGTNENDSDGNGVADSQQATVSPSDPDLVPLAINYPALPAGTVLTLSVVSGGSDIKVYDAAGTALDVSGGGKTWTLPAGAGSKSLLLGAAAAGAGTPFTLNAALSPPAGGQKTTGDNAMATPLGGAIDIDSFNDSGFTPDPHTPGSPEALAANKPGQTGKIVVISDDDLDADWVPDYADGYNRDGPLGKPEDDTTARRKFVPIVLTLPPNFPANGTLRLNYAGPADPFSQVTLSTGANGWVAYALANNAPLRVWKKDATTGANGAQARNGRDVNRSGDFVAPGRAYTPAKLGFTGGQATLYVEAVSVSLAKGDLRIEFEANPTGAAVGGFTPVGAVSLTAVDIDVLIGANDPDDRSLADDWVGAQSGASTHTILNFVTLEAPSGVAVPVHLHGDRLATKGTTGTVSAVSSDFAGTQAAWFTLTANTNGKDHKFFYIRGGAASDASDNISIAADYGQGPGMTAPTGVSIAAETVTVMKFSPERETGGQSPIPINPEVINSASTALGAAIFSADVGRDMYSDTSNNFYHSTDWLGGSILPSRTPAWRKFTLETIEVVWARQVVLTGPSVTVRSTVKSTNSNALLVNPPQNGLPLGPTGARPADNLRVQDLAFPTVFDDPKTTAGVTDGRVNYLLGHPSEIADVSLDMTNNYAVGIEATPSPLITYNVSVHVLKYIDPITGAPRSTGITQPDIPQILSEVNLIWSQAGIRFVMPTGSLYWDQVTNAITDYDVKEGAFPATCSMDDVTGWANTPNLDIYFVNTVTGNKALSGATLYPGFSNLGWSMGPPGVFVAKRLGNQVRDNAGLARTVAHELVHYISKKPDAEHSMNDWNLFVDGGAGSQRDLNGDQVKAMRASGVKPATPDSP